MQRTVYAACRKWFQNVNSLRTFMETQEKQQMSKERKKVLVAFDFDHTLIDANSDLHVRKLAPNGEIPVEIKAKYSHNGWTEYMGAIFAYLHQHNVQPNDILQCIEELSFTSGMKDLLRYLSQDSFEVIIISDSNSIFIDHRLKTADLRETVQEVYTNPAQFDDHGCLTIDYYHRQDWCDLSTVNLCKGHILESHVCKRRDQGIVFSSLAYVGDGFNDLCPCLRLSSKDLAFPRVGFSLHKKILKHEEGCLQAKVIPWTTGEEICQYLKQLQF